MSRTKTHTVRRHCPLLPTTIPRSLNMWATSRWLNQANSAVQDRRGRKRMEEGRNEPWLLSWYELCPRDSLKQWLLTTHVEILPQTVLTWCVWERGKRAEKSTDCFSCSWLRDEVNCKWNQWSKAGAGKTKDMCHRAQEVFCYAVWLCKSWCFRCYLSGRWKKGACPSLQSIFPIALHSNCGGGGALTWRLTDPFFMTH